MQELKQRTAWSLGSQERLVTDGKDLARLDAGELRIDLKPADLLDIAKGTVDAFQADAAERGLAFGTHLDGTLPVLGDAERLTQVL